MDNGQRLVAFTQRSVPLLSIVDSVTHLFHSSLVINELRILTGWLSTSLGRRCLVEEQRLVERVLETVFGDQLLQVGVWGSPEIFIRYARTQHSMLLDFRPQEGITIVSSANSLAVTSDSVDAVVLPHTLEWTRSPHTLLREVTRVLRADGYLIKLCFSPTGFWGLRHLFTSRRGYPPGRRRLISENHLRDWLELLGLEVCERVRYCHTLPLERMAQLAVFTNQALTTRWLPLFSGGYCLVAQKRVYPVTMIRPAWKSRSLKAVGGLVQPNLRMIMPC